MYSIYLSVSTGNMVGLARANRICGIFSKFPTKILIFDSTRPTLQKYKFYILHSKLYSPSASTRCTRCSNRKAKTIFAAHSHYATV